MHMCFNCNSYFKFNRSKFLFSQNTGSFIVEFLQLCDNSHAYICRSNLLCPTPPLFSVRHLPRFLSNTSNIFCPTPPTFSVQHLPRFLSNTSHVFCPTPPKFSNNNTMLSKATNSWEHQTQLPVLYHPWPLACRIEHVTGWPANGAAGPSLLSCPRAVYSMRRMGQRYPEEKDMRLITQMWLHSNKR